MNKSEDGSNEQLTEDEARKRLIEIAAGLGIAVLGTAGAYYFDQQPVHMLSTAAAVGSGAVTVRNVFKYVSKLG